LNTAVEATDSQKKHTSCQFICCHWTIRQTNWTLPEVTLQLQDVRGRRLLLISYSLTGHWEKSDERI
jgi:hypothetical protein